jgi:hypothetical protein
VLDHATQLASSNTMTVLRKNRRIDVDALLADLLKFQFDHS